MNLTLNSYLQLFKKQKIVNEGVFPSSILFFVCVLKAQLDSKVPSGKQLV